MPVFYPDNVQTNSPTINPIVLGLSNHIEGIGYFDAISGGTTNRNSVTSSFRGPGYLAVVFNSTTPGDTDLYVYASTNVTDGAWTTTSNWAEFGSGTGENLGNADLTQSADARTFDLNSAVRTNPSLTFKDGSDEILKISENAGNNSVDVDAVALTLKTATDLRLEDDAGGQYVGFSAPSAVSASYTLEFPSAVATDNRLIQSDSSGVLSYAEASLSGSNLLIGAQTVDLSGLDSNTNLGNTDLTQTAATNRNYEIADGRSLFFNLSGGQNLFELSDGDVAIKTGSGIDIRLLDNSGGQYVGLSAPASATSYTLTFPDAVATADRLIQSNSSGVLSYAEASLSGSNLLIGAQTVDLSGLDTNTNLSTTNLTQSGTTRTYELPNSGTLAFNNNSSAAIFTIDNAGQVVTGNAVDLRLSDDTGGEYVGFSAPSAVSTSYTLTFPSAVATDNRLIQSDSSGNLSYAEASLSGTDLIIGAQTVALTSISGDNLATANLTQGSGDRTYDVNGQKLTFQDSTTELLQVDGASDVVGIMDGSTLRFYDDDDSAYVGLTAPAAVDTSYSFTFPTALTTGAERFLVADSTGVISFGATGLGFFSGVAGVAVGNVSVNQEFTQANLQDLFNAIFVAFDVSGLSISASAGTVEHGTSVSESDLGTFTVTFSAPTLGDSNSLSLATSDSNLDYSGETIASGLALPTDDASPTVTVTTAQYAFTTATMLISNGQANGTLRARATAQEGGSNVNSGFLTLASVRFRAYFGASSTDLDSAANPQTDFGTVISDVSSTYNSLTASKNVTFTADSDSANLSNFTYIIMPVGFGALTAIELNDSLPVLTSFNLVASNLTQLINGQTVTYRCYQSTTQGAYADGDTLNCD